MGPRTATAGNTSGARPPLGLAGLLLTAAGAAQGATWVVDAANGPGTHFTELQAALAAAQVSDGDRLLVRAGTYGRCVTSKGVTVLGEAGARIVTQGVSIPALRVTGLPAGRTFTLDRLAIAHDPFFGDGVTLQGNQGRVCLDDVVVQGNAAFPSTRQRFPSLSVHGCDFVTVDESALLGGAGVEASTAQLFVTRTRVTGMNAYDLLGGSIGSSAAFTIGSGGEVWLSQVDADGGRGTTAQSSAPAVSAPIGGASLTIAGDGRAALRAGAPNGFPFPRSAIQMVAGDLRIAPSVVLVPNPGAPPIAAPTTRIVVAPVPFLTVASAPPAGALALEVNSAPGDALFLAVGLPGPPLVVPFGTIHLDVSAMLTLAIAVQGPSGRFALSVPVPGQGALHGLVLVGQAANAAGSGVLRLTNPVVFSLH
jgi:hypothetical protein